MRLVSLVLAACVPVLETGDARPDPSDSGTPPADTADPDPVPPTRIDVACTPAANPLRAVCHVSVAPPQPVAVQFSRADGLGAVRTHQSLVTATDHDVPLYLMAPEQTYDVVATALAWPDNRLATARVDTGALPVLVDTRLEVDGTPTAPLIGTELPCGEEAIAVIYDTTTGDLLWYEELDPLGTLGLMHMVRFTDEHTVLGETQRSIVEVDLAGNTLVRLERNLDYSEGFHHDIFKWNGRYYLLYQTVGLGPILDALLVIDTEGNQIARWLPDRYLDIPDDAIGDWMHTNTVFVDPGGDILLSLRTQATIVKLQGDVNHPDFGRPIWILAGAPPAGLGSDFTIDWTGISLPHAFEEQHDVSVRRDGRLSLLDDPSGRALILTVEPLTGTATVDAEIPTSDPVCLRQGTATETTSGNPVVACSSGAVREVDLATGAQLWEATPACASVRGSQGIDAARWYPLEGW